jgi:hypothetical protein
MLYLVAKSPMWGPDVDGLACSLQRPTVCSHQRGGQSFLTGTAPSCHAVVGGAIFYVMLTIRLPARPNFIWRNSLYRAHAYPMSELSW